MDYTFFGFLEVSQKIFTKALRTSSALFALASLLLSCFQEIPSSLDAHISRL
jgi:hypothetical protein